MAKLFVELSIDEQEVLNVSTIKSGPTMLEVELLDPVFYFDKLKGYTVRVVKDQTYELIFDQEKYNAHLEEINKRHALYDAKRLREELATTYVLDNATDDDAYVMRYLYNEWASGILYKVNDRIRYNDNLYKCKQEHTSQAEHTPDLVPALWDLVNGDETKGTLENPIEIPKPFSSMVYAKGKYYEENDDIYLMNRAGMRDGEEISLTYKPSQLVEHYFQLVTDQENGTDSGTTDTEEIVIPEFKQPSGTHDAYKKGDRVSYNGKIYESAIDNNVYSPEAYPSGWKEII